MSLFKVRTWWTTQCTDLEDNYDVASLLCTRFGLEEHEKDYIVVGSHSGLLSIFYPNAEIDSNHNIKEFQPTDLLLECQLKAPILSVLSGRFTGNFRSENTNQLAILHPNNLAIYNLTTVDGIADHGSHSQLESVAEHTFARAAFSLCKGHFGHVKGREFFCIGHLDGSLTFYEQDGITYECNLPGPKPLPSALLYVERTDSFLRVNSSWNLESFSYQDLSHSTINKSDASPIWSCCLGEGVLDLSAVQIKETSTWIMVLGERNLIAISDHGYYWEADAHLITAIIAENYKLFIYNGPTLLWAAQLEDIPIAMQRSNLNNLPGGIVTLGPTGIIRVSFLGSEPHVFQIPPLNLDEMNFERAHRELLQLEGEIKQAVDLDDIDVINQMAENDLRLEFTINSQLNECTFEVPQDLTGIPMCGGCLKLKLTSALEEIQIAICTPQGVRCSLDTLTYNDVAANTEKELQVQFYLAENLHIATTKIEVLASFINKQGIPRVLTKVDHLPLAMLYRSIAPQKTALVKVTLNINSSKSMASKLSGLFPEFCSSGNDVQAVGLTLLQSPTGNEVVTIVTAKNSNRIRIQSDCLEALPLVLERILNSITDAEDANREEASTRGGRKGKKSNGSGGDGHTKAIIASPSIPVADILRRIDDHYGIQKNIRKQTGLMDALWIQFKLFQRSLQSNVDGERNDGILMLIERNYDDLVVEGDKLVDMRTTEKSRRCDLSCAITVAKQIISCMKLETKTLNLIRSILNSQVQDWTELCWEESMAPGIDMLHHYGPLNRSKSAGSLAANTDVSHAQYDYDRLRRHFATLFDRVCRLASAVVVKKSIDTDDGTNEFSQYLEDANEEHKTPGKSKILAKQSRLAALEDDDEEEDSDESNPKRRPKSDWLNTANPEESDILTEMVLKENVGTDL